MVRSERREQRTRARILEKLVQEHDGMTICGLADELDMHYTTASKYLLVLEAEQKVVHRNIGMAKVFRAREAVLA